MVSASLRLVDTYLQAGLEALADPTRFSIFQSLAGGPMAVSELADRFPVSRPAVSQHLRVLKNAGLVMDRKAGARRIYEVNPVGIEVLRAHFERLWEQALGAFAEAASEEVVANKGTEKKGKHKKAGERQHERTRGRRT
jgi:DNA-binding transcriptional ArsR family regulator